MCVCECEYVRVCVCVSVCVCVCLCVISVSPYRCISDTITTENIQFDAETQPGQGQPTIPAAPISTTPKNRHRSNPGTDLLTAVDCVRYLTLLLLKCPDVCHLRNYGIILPKA